MEENECMHRCHTGSGQGYKEKYPMYLKKINELDTLNGSQTQYPFYVFHGLHKFTTLGLIATNTPHPRVHTG